MTDLFAQVALKSIPATYSFKLIAKIQSFVKSIFRNSFQQSTIALSMLPTSNFFERHKKNFMEKMSHSLFCKILKTNSST